MLHKTLPLREGSAATLTTYIHDQSSQSEFQIQSRPGIIVMPGGAYSFLSDTEAEPVALTFLKEGYNTFVLRYSVGDACTIRRFWRRCPWPFGRCAPTRRSGTPTRRPLW